MPELERALRDLGRELSFPPTPELAAAVGDRLRVEPFVRRRWPRRRRRLVLALAVALVALSAALAVPAARTAILEFFGIGGVSVERVERLPAYDRWQRLVRGELVEFDEAQAAVDFRILAPPTKGGCRRCGKVFLDRSVAGGLVTFVWPGETPRLLLMEFRGEAVPFARKQIGPGTRVEQPLVDDHPALWIEGAEHVVLFADRRGRIHERPRLARNVLIWERGGVTLRLEGDIPKRQALDLAHALR